MADDSFTLRIVTPEGLALEERVTAVTLEGSDGEIGVLPQHVMYTGILGTGVLRYDIAGGRETSRVVVSGGFCQFTGDTLSVLADSIDTLESVDRDAYSADRGKLTAVISGDDTLSPEWARAKEKLARIEAIDELLGRSA